VNQDDLRAGTGSSKGGAAPGKTAADDSEVAFKLLSFQ
jgi:hypothetical protein